MTGQAGKVSRGLRTIGANITQLAQNAKEFDITVNGATKTIQLWNETGTDMLNTYDVLKQISAEWDNMTNAEKSSLAIDLAKKTQMDTFLAVLGNFEDAEKAYTTALLSEGSAWKENEKYMESIEAHQAKLKQAWEELVLSKPIEDLEKSLLNAGTALLKFANSDIAQTLIKVTAFITAMGLLYKTTKAFITLIQAKSATSIFASAITSLIAGEATLTQVTIGLTTAMLSNPLFWGAAAVLGITAIVKVIDAFTVSYEEATEALNDSLATYEQAQSEIESLTSKLEELEKVKSEINEKKLEITDDEQLQELNQQTDELERQEAILQRQLALAKAKAEVAQQDARKAAQDSLTSTVSTESTAVIGYGVVGGRGGTIGTRFEGAITALQSLQEKIIANNRELEVLNQNYDANEDKIKEITAKNEILVQAYEATYKEASTLADTVTDITDALGDETEAYEGSENSLGALLDGLTKLVGWKTDATDKTTEFTNATEDEEDALQEDGEAVNEASNAWDEFLDNIEDVQSAYEILTKAADEYNQNGFITASTLKQLNKLSPEYLAILAQEGDTYENINSALGDYLDKEKEQAIQKVNLARYTSILELCENTLKEQTEKTSKVVEESGTKASEASEGYDELGNAAIKAAIGMKAVEDGGLNTDEFYEKFNKINDYFDGLVDNINKTNLGATKSSKSAAGSSKDAWVEAFKEEQRQLKHSLEMNEITELEYYERLKDLNEKYFGEISGNHQKYIKEYQENEEEIYKGTKAVYDKVKDYLKEAVEQGYEKAINALKREEKAVLAEIKATIDALKREKDETLKGIKRKIDALKRQKEQVQKTYNEEIDKLKEVNDTLQKQNELLKYKQELQQAKSQKVMVMKGGQFTLSENESAVAEAEKNLAEYEEQTSYEQQIEELEKLRDAEVEYIENKIDSLEKYYDYMESYYDERIQQMEDYYNQVEAQYEKQIEALQTELDAFKEGYKKSEDLDNARLAVEVLAANEEAHIWQQRLDNLANAINAYNTLLDKIGEGEVSGGVFTAATVTYRAVESMANVNTAIPHRAKGDASFKGDEVALVGESPNAELVLGSHLNRSVNSGSLIHLSKGSGVVNAESTATLAGLLNGIVKPNNISNNRSVVQTFTFDNLTLPNVTDSNSFVSALSHKFNNYAIQYGNKR